MRIVMLFLNLKGADPLWPAKYDFMRWNKRKIPTKRWLLWITGGPVIPGFLTENASGDQVRNNEPHKPLDQEE